MVGTRAPTSCGSMLALDGGFRVAACQNQEAFDIVAQLADVARPVVRLQHRERVLADRPAWAGRWSGKSAARRSRSVRECPRAVRRERVPGSAPPRGDETGPRGSCPAVTSASRLRLVEEDDADVDMHPRRAADPHEISGRPVRAGSCFAFLSACRRFRRGKACRRAPPPARRRCGRASSPLSTPNNSISMRSGVMVTALVATNGPEARADWAWIIRAVSFLARAGWADEQDAAVGRGDALDRRLAADLSMPT